MQSARLWLAAFLIIAALAPSPVGLHIDHWVRAHTATLPRSPHALLMVVWPIGQPAVAAALLLVLTLDERIGWTARWRAWGALLVTELVEVVCKHYGVGGAGTAVAVPMPHWWEFVTRHVSVPLPISLTNHLRGFRLKGSFPSGHVLRLTLASNYLVPWPNVIWPTVATAIVGVGVVATGGHSLTDALGGATLAFGALAAIGRLPSRRSGRNPQAVQPVPVNEDAASNTHSSET